MAVVLLAMLGGGVAGFGGRLWLARLRRGTVVRAGAVELPAALISGLGAALADRPVLPMVLWMGLLTVLLSVVDLREHRLPDAITLPAIPVTLAVAWGSAWLLPGAGSGPRAVLGCVLVGGLFLALAWIYPPGMGRGDAKLAFSVGAALGSVSWPAVLIGVFLGFVLGSIGGLAWMLVRRGSLKAALPFGPAMLLGCWLVLAIPVLWRGW